jgi:uncharacterized protein (DUF1800 family)
MALMDEYLVSETTPWSAIEAAHLLRRAGFGGTPAEIEAAIGDEGPQALLDAVDALVNFLPEDPNLDAPSSPGPWGGPIAGLPDDPVDDDSSNDTNEGQTKTPRNDRRLEAHLFYRIFYTSQPFQEQFNLFLMDHFVSEFPKVEQLIGQFQRSIDRRAATAEQLLFQNKLLRETGIDRFSDTLREVSRNGAMLLYLDNWLNGSGDGRAQENYAREVMELFSMGVNNYSEEDVREIAKSLTGETLDGFRDDGSGDAFDHRFRDGNHVEGDKTVFGQVVTEDMAGGELVQIIDLILSKTSVQPNVSDLSAPYNDLPAAAVYMSWKLLRWFLNQNVSLDPPDQAVLELADYMRGTDDAEYPLRRYPYDMRACMRKLLTSQCFYDVDNFFSITKTPADFCASALRLSQAAVGLSSEDFDYNRSIYSDSPVNSMRGMGMQLFNPPDVSGWRQGRPWINAEYLLTRYYFLERITRRHEDWGPSDQDIDDLQVLNGGALDPSDFESIMNHFITVIVQDDIEVWAPGSTTQLMNYMDEVAADESNVNRRFRRQVRGLMYLLMSLPMWQMK